MKRLQRVGIVVAAAGVLAASLLAESSESVARAELEGREGSRIAGSVTFTEKAGTVEIVAEVENAPPGVHGFHLHEKGDCSAADFTSTGGHFNPGESAHGGPGDEVRHAGDFGNITIGEDGKGRLVLTSTRITVADGPLSVRGRGLILHADTDDLTTQPTGAAGARIACGVIE